ncbi:MAG: hypothetical protein FWE29_06800 [Defluviitaleaceae bacterium]|nr:hypothetical protein [Defluviitaleaceae bacterium]
MKKLFRLLLVAIVILILTACGSTDETAGRYESDHVDNATSYLEYAIDYLENEEPSPTPEPSLESTLIGTWLWMGSPYYVFEQNGYGTMSGSDIRWTSREGVLSICSTPSICGITCFAPSEWNYTLDENQLILTSRLTANLTFTYTRRN